MEGTSYKFSVATVSENVKATPATMSRYITIRKLHHSAVLVSARVLIILFYFIYQTVSHIFSL